MDSGAGSEEHDGLAVALAGIAGKQHLRELVRLVEDESNGPSRIFFLKPIMRIGGPRERQYVASLVDDPDLGKEATAIARRARSTRE